ncbi:ABC transporter ATP-binding protein [Flammeovirga yaeyamensis]|nr:ABC transporter ATP-binding protein [Flammeovirga yaeyamensis]
MMIKVKNLSKSYEEVEALKNISFDVKSKEIFGLIGPDGAGKTTLMRILTSLLLFDDGEVEVMGKSPIKDYQFIRNNIGYMPGKFSLYEDLTVEENLSFFANIFGTTIEKSYNLIKDIYQQIEPFKNRKAGALSGGMKQKLALCAALIHYPKILFLDEPTTGVDPVSRKEFWHIIKKLHEHDITIFVSTPYMDEANLCDRIALIDKGEILNIDQPQNISKVFDKHLYGIQCREGNYQLMKHLRAYEHFDSVFPFGEQVHYTDQRNEDITEGIYQFLESKGLSDIKLEKIESTIEDVFIRLMTKN